MCFSLSFLQIYFVFSYMYANMCGDREGQCRTCMQGPQRPEKGVTSPEPECQLCCEGAGNSVAVLGKSSKPLTLSKQSLNLFLHLLARFLLL